MLRRLVHLEPILLTHPCPLGYFAERTTDPKGGVTEKVYDKANRLVRVIDSGQTTSFDYYDNGNRKSVTYPDGSKELYTYNKIGQNTALINLRADGTLIDQYSYTYDAAGNQTSKTDAKGTTNFVYDKLNRLSEVQEPTGVKTVYTYDKAGNRIREQKYSGEAFVQDTHYTYDANNRLTQTETRTAATDDTVKTVYNYDAVGNMTSQSKTAIKAATAGNKPTFVLEKGKASENLVTIYTYNNFNQLKSSDDGVNKTTYGYNGFGLRTDKSVKTRGKDEATVTKYLYEGDKIILELDGAGNQVAKNTFGTNLLSREMAETKVYYMYNGHGDVTALLSETGDIVGSYYYDVWGNTLEKHESEAITNPYRYAGYQYDEETDLYYLNARYYDAKIARFLTEDSVTGDRKDPLSLNRYSYCHNNPIAYTDPTGNVATMSYMADGGRNDKTTTTAKSKSVTSKSNKNVTITNDSTQNKKDKAKQEQIKKDIKDIEVSKAKNKSGGAKIEANKKATQDKNTQLIKTKEQMQNVKNSNEVKETSILGKVGKVAYSTSEVAVGAATTIVSALYVIKTGGLGAAIGGTVGVAHGVNSVGNGISDFGHVFNGEWEEVGQENYLKDNVYKPVGKAIGQVVDLGLPGDGSKGEKIGEIAGAAAFYVADIYSSAKAIAKAVPELMKPQWTRGFFGPTDTIYAMEQMNNYHTNKELVISITKDAVGCYYSAKDAIIEFASKIFD